MTILPICQICNKTVSEMQVERDIPSHKILAHYRCHGEHETQEITESLPNNLIWPTTVFKSSSCQGSRPDTSDSPSPAIPQGPFGHWHELYSEPQEMPWLRPSKPEGIIQSLNAIDDLLSEFDKANGLAPDAMAYQRPTAPYGSHASPKVDADILAGQLEIMTDHLAYVLNHCDVGLMQSKFEAELTEARTVLREYYSPNGRQELRDRISTVLKREPKPVPYNPIGPNTLTSRIIPAMQDWFRKK